MWTKICILESGGHKGIAQEFDLEILRFLELIHIIFFQLDLLLGKSISRKKILNMYTTSKEFELRDFEGDDIIQKILYCNNIALFIINTALLMIFL